MTLPSPGPFGHLPAPPAGDTALSAQPPMGGATVPGAPAGGALPPPTPPPGGPANMGPAPPPIPPPPAAQRSRAGGIALGAIVATLVVGGGGAAILLSMREKKELPSPVLFARLPPNTVSVSAGPLHGELAPSDAATRQATVSALAGRFCGGIDIVGELIAARRREPEAAVRALAALRDPIVLADPMKCGKALAEAMEGRMVAQIGLTDGAETRRLMALRHKLSVGAMPGFVDNGFGSMLGRCMPPKAGQKTAGGTCGEGNPAGFSDGNSYFAGRSEDVAAFAGSFKKEGGKRDEAEPARALTDLSSEITRGDAWDLRFRPDSVDLALPCLEAAPADAVLEMAGYCLPPGHEGDGTTIAADVKAAGVVRIRPESGQAVGFDYLFLPRDGGRENVKAKLDAYAAAWSAHVKSNEAAILKTLANAKDPRDLVFKAVARTYVEALKTPEVVVSGGVVHLRVQKNLFDDDKAQIKTVLAATSEDVQRAGAVVDALAEGKTIPVDAIGYFLGPELAGWLLSPTAAVADCKAIAKHANDLSNAPDFANDQFLPMTEMIESWGGVVPENEKEEIKIDEKVCTERRLPPDLKTCLVGAKTMPDMSKCPVVAPPQAATLLARIQGKWRTPLSGSVTGSTSGSVSGSTGGDVWGRRIGEGPTQAPSAASSSLSVEGRKAQLTGAESATGELAFVFVHSVVAAEYGGDAMFARVRIGERRMDLIFGGDKVFLVTTDIQSGKKKPAIVLERVTGS